VILKVAHVVAERQKNLFHQIGFQFSHAVNVVKNTAKIAAMEVAQLAQNAAPVIILSMTRYMLETVLK
jgi:ethanolamine utilization microcompartment shell protein EutS